ncbi:MAG: thiamine phosphate synthase [Chloroflexota bacterium]
MAVAMTDHPFPARLLVVADLDYVGDEARWLTLLGTVGAAAVGRPVAIQVRAKHLDGAEASDVAARARNAVPRDVPLLLNGPTALAAQLGYTGVHWPEADIPTARPPQPLAFRSAAVHSIEAARRAEAAGADLVIAGAVYAPGSHPGEGMGLDAFGAIARATSLPAFAIGGIHPAQVEDCMRAGASGVAVVSGILGAPDVGAAIDEYLQAIDAATGSEPA